VNRNLVGSIYGRFWTTRENTWRLFFTGKIFTQNEYDIATHWTCWYKIKLDVLLIHMYQLECQC
jgi:hypothetical protein